MLSHGLFAQTMVGDTVVQKGYLFFDGILGLPLSEEASLVYFFPSDNVHQNFTLREIEKLPGRRIYNDGSKRLQKIKRKAKAFVIYNKIFDTNNHLQLEIDTIKIAPAEIKYVRRGEVLEGESGIPFVYQGRDYLFNYIEIWIVPILDVIPVK
jgi:hypothetical protein